MKFGETAQSPNYQRWAENESKAYIGWFLVVCVGLAAFSDIKLGVLWFAFVPLGMIIASVVGGVFSIVGKWIEYRAVPILPSLARLAGLITVIVATYSVHRALGR